MNGVFCGGFSIAMFDDRRVMIPGKLWPSLALSFFCAATHVRELIDPFVKEMSKSKSLSLGGRPNIAWDRFSFIGRNVSENFEQRRLGDLNGDGCIITTVFVCICHKRITKEGQKEEGKGSEAKDGAIFF